MLAYFTHCCAISIQSNRRSNSCVLERFAISLARSLARSVMVNAVIFLCVYVAENLDNEIDPFALKMLRLIPAACLAMRKSWIIESNWKRFGFHWIWFTFLVEHVLELLFTYFPLSAIIRTNSTGIGHKQFATSPLTNETEIEAGAQLTVIRRSLKIRWRHQRLTNDCEIKIRHCWLQRTIFSRIKDKLKTNERRIVCFLVENPFLHRQNLN